MNFDLRQLSIDLCEVLVGEVKVDDRPSARILPIWCGGARGLTSSPSAYVVRAASASDVSAAVQFAQLRNIRLVVKGGGHSYLGGSNAPDSLLVWTRDMEATAQ